MRLFRNRSFTIFPKRKRRGQSLVEFTLMLPILLMLLSGVIEYGFMLNFYLDVIDAARETARFAANDDPIRNDLTGLPTPWNLGFEGRAQLLAKQSLDAASDGRIDWLPPVDCSTIRGDVVLSAFSVLGNTVDKRYPVGTGDTGVSMCPANGYTSKMTIADVNSILSGASIPNSGFVLIELYYEYEMVLGLPWIQAIVPDPMILYAYSIMPNTNLEPTPTP